MDELNLEEIEKACERANELSLKVQRREESPNVLASHAIQCTVWVPALVAEVKRLRESVEIWQDKEKP